MQLQLSILLLPSLTCSNSHTVGKITQSQNASAENGLHSPIFKIHTHYLSFKVKKIMS